MTNFRRKPIIPFDESRKSPARPRRRAGGIMAAFRLMAWRARLIYAADGFRPGETFGGLLDC
jgi:hypothetical protein